MTTRSSAQEQSEKCFTFSHNRRKLDDIRAESKDHLFLFPPGFTAQLAAVGLVLREGEYGDFSWCYLGKCLRVLGSEF